MYLKSLEIERFRAFRHTDIRFRYPGEAATGTLKYPNVNLLLGNNGMGKSAALKAAALALMSPVLASTGYRPYSLVRREVREDPPRTAVVEARVVLDDQDLADNHGATSDTSILRARVSRRHTTETCEFDPVLASAVWEPMYSEDSPAFFFVGYGVSRTVESPAKVDSSLRRRVRHLRYERVAGLFEEQATLMPLAAWLPILRAANYYRYMEVEMLLNRLLPEGASFHNRMLDGDYAFGFRRLDVPFSALSDGFRAYIGWVGDLLYHMCECCPDETALVDHRGIVMIDEVDLHLHPEWQLVVLPTVSQALPQIQFLCTTHSPIVAGTVESANLFLVVPDRDHKTTSVLVTPELEVHGLTADQILTSSHFGLVSTRAPDFYKELQRVSSDVSRGKPGAAVRFMEMTSLGAGAGRVDDE
jgi:hypothetical protein